MKQIVDSDGAMRRLGRRLGKALGGGEVLELIGDVGAGKTTLTKGLAEGLDISGPVQSPTFTISRVYKARDDLELRHYDFYRLSEAGIMTEELAEALNSPDCIVVVEWGGAVEGVLPSDRLQVHISTTGELSRVVDIHALGDKSRQVLSSLGGGGS